MNKKEYWILILLILWGGGCGTGVGNPDGSYSPSADFSSGELSFATPVEEYEEWIRAALDCGSFTGASPVAEVDAGRQCIREALEACTQPAGYLLDEATRDAYGLVSFVSVRIVSATPWPVCELRVHTVCNDPDLFVGDEVASCSGVDPWEVLELACGIGR